MPVRVVLIFAAAVVTASAQTVGASLQGVISDQSAGVLPNAAFQILNLGTGARHTLVTDENGLWRAPALPPREHQLRASAPGFQTISRQHVPLEIGPDAVVDLTMEFGPVISETIAKCQ